MYAGYTESAEKIEARKRRILAGYRPDRQRTAPATSTSQPKPAGQQGNESVTLNPLEN